MLRLVSRSGEVYALAERTLVGRDARCEICIPHKSVSRKHALIEWDGGDAWTIRDQASANGILLDGHKVTQGALHDGQELVLGAVHLRVEEVQQPLDDADSVLPGAYGPDPRAQRGVAARRGIVEAQQARQSWPLVLVLSAWAVAGAVVAFSLGVMAAYWVLVRGREGVARTTPPTEAAAPATSVADRPPEPATSPSNGRRKSPYLEPTARPGGARAESAPRPQAPAAQRQEPVPRPRPAGAPPRELEPRPPEKRPATAVLPSPLATSADSAVVAPKAPKAPPAQSTRPALAAQAAEPRAPATTVPSPRPSPAERAAAVAPPHGVVPSRPIPPTPVAPPPAASPPAAAAPAPAVPGMAPLRAPGSLGGRTAAAQVSEGILAIVARQECTVVIDNDRRVPITPGHEQTVKVPAGVHVIVVNGADGKPLWQKLLTVEAGGRTAVSIEGR